MPCRETAIRAIPQTRNTKEMNQISYEYAVNFEQNEKKWEERREKIRDVILYFTKNTLLQFIAMEILFRAYDFDGFIDKGDRGQFLASEIDKFLSDFDQTKAAYEKSGVTDQITSLARRITNQTIKK